MILGCYYLTMDPTVEIICRPENVENFRSLDNLKSGNDKVGIAFRSNGYYYGLNNDIANVSVFEDHTEEDENGRRVTVESAVDRTVRAVVEGEVDAMLANTIEIRKLIADRNLENDLVIANLHERRLVVDMDEVEYLYKMGIVNLHTPILLGNYNDLSGPQDELEPCTVGRAIFNRILPDQLRFVQETLGKKGLNNLVARVYDALGNDDTTDVVDAIKNYGFKYATVSGTTIAVSDLTIPDDRKDILESAEKRRRTC
jgi:hypothetical protein